MVWGKENGEAVNIYYNPEKFGLEVVDELDYGGSYEFDMCVLFRRVSDGHLLLGADSGCSCPAPFDGVKVADLVDANVAYVYEWYNALPDYQKDGRDGPFELTEKIRAWRELKKVGDV